MPYTDRVANIEKIRTSVREANRRRRAKPGVREKEREHAKLSYHRKPRTDEVKLCEYGKWIKHRFGLSLEQYDKMLKDQDYRCAICRSSSVNSKRVKRFSVDHDHKTGKIRGLLCTPCNRGIGLLGDSVQRAVAYLEKPGTIW